MNDINIEYPISIWNVAFIFINIFITHIKLSISY